MSDDITSNNQASSDSDETTPEYRHSSHEYNDSWSWTDAFTRFVKERVGGYSLKVCTGERPICDINVDIDPEGTQADQYGDMFDLDFDANTFDTVVSDPPWVNMSTEDRQTLITELVRVCKPEGDIIFNATWIPDHEVVSHEEFRARQEDDFGGNSSVVTFSEKFDLVNLYRVEEYDAFPDDPDAGDARHQHQVFWNKIRAKGRSSVRENPEDADIDPRSVDGQYEDHRCPICLNPGLDYVGDYDDVPEAVDFSCGACWFRSSEGEVEHRKTMELREWERLDDWMQENRVEILGWDHLHSDVQDWLIENRTDYIEAQLEEQGRLTNDLGDQTQQTRGGDTDPTLLPHESAFDAPAGVIQTTLSEFTDIEAPTCETEVQATQPAPSVEASPSGFAPAND